MFKQLQLPVPLYTFKFQNSVQPFAFSSISFPWQKGSEIAWNGKTDFSLQCCSELSLGLHTTSTLMASETWQIAARKDDRHPRSSIFFQLNGPSIMAINPSKRSRVKQEQNCLHIVQIIFCLVPNDEGSRRKEFASTANTEDLKSVSRMWHTGSCQPDQFNIVRSTSGLHGILSGKHSAVTTNWHSRTTAVKSFSVLFQLMFSCPQLWQQESLALWLYSLELNTAAQLSGESTLAIAKCTSYASSYIFIWQLSHPL